MIDLHVHSTYSDGTLTPAQLVSLALEKQLTAFALTDHDTVAGIDEAKTASIHTPLQVIAGIELSTSYQGRDVHILGLSIDHRNAYFLDQLEYFRNSRDRRNQEMIQKLQAHGIDISYEQMREDFPDPQMVWTRAHFGKYLLTHGYVGSSNEAFDRYLGDRASCFVPREKVTLYQAISLIHEAGGKAVLAHPLLYGLSESNLEQLVFTCKKAGADGIEAIYSRNRSSDESHMRQLAKKYNLKITGGSDYHGTNKPDIDLGCGTGNLKIPNALLAHLLE